MRRPWTTAVPSLSASSSRKRKISIVTFNAEANQQILKAINPQYILLVVNKHFPCSSLFSLVYSFLINRFWDFRTTCYLWTPYQKASWPTVACPPCYWKETCLKWRFIRLNRYVHLTITLFDHTQALQQLDGHELYLERFAETRKKLDWWFDKTCNFLKNT